MEEIRVGAKQVDFMIGTSAPDPVSIPQIEAGLAVHAEVSNFLVAAQQDFNHSRIRHHQRAVRQRMRRHRSNHKSINVRHYHGTASRERVRSRTRGRGYDHSIGPVTRDERLIHKTIVVVEASQRRLVNHDVVESLIASADLFAPKQIALYQATPLHCGTSLRDRIEHGEESWERNNGEEAQ